MSKQIIISNFEEIETYKNRILENSKDTAGKVAQTLIDMDSMAALKLIKFKKCGMDPLFASEQNFIEQLNQTFTYLVCLEASKILMNKHDQVPFIVNFGTQNGFDIVSMDNDIICECFASTVPDSNQKLEKDSKRVSQCENESFRYVIFYSEEEKNSYVKRIENKYDNVSVIQLKDI